MAKFATGLLLGALAGGLYGLLTTKKTGTQHIEAVTNYVDDVTAATQDFQTSLTHFKNSVNHFNDTVQTTGVTVAEGLKDTLDTFQFETQPRIDQLNDTVTELTESLNDVAPK
ncbi:hypothetical protein FC83_GL000789 [Agrilactobacillus composti DSM 18527 = JCM 14202]|uniref:YtxH domain-containing protein n=1 Tax=Agrilactobacillus composti DSM 18527 = JCM 14202 TaxID=1423734 RepID=X0PE83_9LACO|nr:YtxH domain-containing protein [Agrilactobacillus composti]KRM35762.1 hypothetical protein FC83_GL000789 [Agrilactobacillus composti DSM 18527 = JCM 14202]GAF39623.1 hypothetical protein JCM14202_1492 [Agrilactobacillus composti DSM 18527 = JCM 14202]